MAPIPHLGQGKPLWTVKNPGIMPSRAWAGEPARATPRRFQHLPPRRGDGDLGADFTPPSLSPSPFPRPAPIPPLST